MHSTNLIIVIINVLCDISLARSVINNNYMYRLVLEARSSQQSPTVFLTRMMEQRLTLNNFTFDDEHCLQVHGLAVGTVMAPSFANLFMAILEDRLLTWTSTRPYIWWRYIDDVFAIWDGGQDQFDVFLREINEFHHCIKFAAEFSMDRVTFLDTTMILEGDAIQTEMYTKPTDTHQYLSLDSCHAKHCTTSIPYSQSLRIQRIGSREEEFTKRIDELKSYLMAQSYPESLVDARIQKVARTPQTETLQPHPHGRPMDRMPLVTTYHPGLTRPGGIARRHLAILHTSDTVDSSKPFPNHHCCLSGDHQT